MTYNASSSSSSKDGVTITAAITGTAITKDVSLTVGGQALRINLGTGNEIDGDSLTLYKAPWTVIVTDANGNAAPSRNVQLSVVPVRYFKGQYAKPVGEDTWYPNYSVAGGCTAEDANNNGILDTGEDANGNGQLDPDPSATVPANITTGTDGTADFSLTYLKSECSWIQVNLTATTNVQGTESGATKQFILPCTADDLNSSSPPGGLPSPYGTASDCAIPN